MGDKTIIVSFLLAKLLLHLVEWKLNMQCKMYTVEKVSWSTQLFQDSRCLVVWALQGVKKGGCGSVSLLISSVAFITITEWHSAAGKALYASLFYVLSCLTCNYIAQAVWSCNWLFTLCRVHLIWELDNIAALLNGHQLSFKHSGHVLPGPEAAVGLIVTVIYYVLTCS